MKLVAKLVHIFRIPEYQSLLLVIIPRLNSDLARNRNKELLERKTSLAIADKT